MKRRTFIKASSATAALTLISKELALVPSRDISVFYDPDYTPRSSILVTRVTNLINTFNQNSSVKIFLQPVSKNHYVENGSFISSPDNFEFNSAVISGFSEFTFLGNSRTFEEKINRVTKLTPAYEAWLAYVGYSPINLGVGPDLQADILKLGPVKKFAVYDQKSYLYSRAINAEPVNIIGPLNQYFENFYTHFDGTAPLFLREFYGDQGLKISKDLIRIGHFLSPMLFSMYISDDDLNTLGDGRLQLLKELAQNQLHATSLAMNGYARAQFTI